MVSEKYPSSEKDYILNLIRADQVCKRVVDHLNEPVFDDGRIFSRALLDGIDRLAQEKSLSKTFFDSGLLNALSMVEAGIDFESTMELGNLASILCTMKSHGHMDFAGEHIYECFLRREEEDPYFGDYDDRQRFPAILEMLRKEFA